MRIRHTTLLSCTLVFLMACHAESVNVPLPEVSPFGLKPSPILYSDCPAGRTCVAAQNLGPVSAIMGNLVPSCASEVGCSTGGTRIYAFVTEDAEVGNIDVLTMNCANGTFTARSDHGCWDCVGGCGGSVGPDGIQWQTVTVLDTLGGSSWMGQIGSDCYAFRCHDPGSYYFSGENRAPVCLTDNPPPGGGLAPPQTTAYTVNGKPYLTWPSVPGAAAYRVYRHLEGRPGPEIWYTWLEATSYTDWSTDVSGDPQSSPDPQWPDTSWAVWARYHVVSLAADGTESGYVVVHYYHTPNGGPY